MAKRTGSIRRKTRNKFKKNINDKGKISIRKYLQKFEKEDKVVLKLDPSVHKGAYPRRNHGKVGIIQEKKGTCYIIKIKENNKEKSLIIHPVHLTKV